MKAAWFHRKLFRPELFGPECKDYLYSVWLNSSGINDRAQLLWSAVTEIEAIHQ